MSQLVVELQQVDVLQANRKVLQQVNLRISQGEFVYLIGKTGSGKSSLLKTLYGALPLEIGQGRVAGFDLRQLNRKTIPSLRRQLGIVFQDFSLLTDRSVAENLDFVLQATDWQDGAKRRAQIEKLLAQVGLADALDKMPFTLSGGEQQRLAIARALLNDPVLILADEPTGNLDPETSDEILQLLRKLAKERNTAVLLATHDYRILEHFPARILRCFNQRVINDEDIQL
ncbi:MAG: ATP-binding cassette domain-containing protein [Bacteroidetes bacterium]|nr:MAG: ATP-binding cassette domain-containing protein [Bacteroidota bacterium]